MTTDIPKREKDPQTQTRTLNGVVSFASALALLLILVVATRLPDDAGILSAAEFLVAAVLCPFLAMTAIGRGYLMMRDLRWLERQKTEKASVAELHKPVQVLRPETFDNIALIDAAQKTILPVVPNAQGQFRVRALTTYMAPAIAVLLTGLQLSRWFPVSFSAGLIAGQALLLVFVIVRVLTDRSPTAEWIARRTRAELLRREQYLRLARVGPYHRSRDATVEGRIEDITNATVSRMSELYRMDTDDRRGETWLDVVSDHAADDASKEIIDDLPARASCYHYYRVGKQIAWMRSAAATAAEDARRLEKLVASVTVTAVIAATFNAADLLLLHVSPLTRTLPTPTHVTILVGILGLATFLPALSGALLALQSVFNLRFLTETYRVSEDALERLRAALTRLLEDLDHQWEAADATARRRFEVRFQRLVLNVEGVLTEEYVRWRIITQRDAYELV